MRKSDAKWKFVSFFCLLSSFLLFITAAAKIVSVVGAQKILDVPDPILGASNRMIMATVGICELVIVFLLLKKKTWFTYLLTSMLGGQFLLYHYIFSAGAYTRGCPCLGTLGGWLPFSHQTMDKALLAIASWLFIGGAIACHFAFPYKSNEKAPGDMESITPVA
jgi:hypothetical protein